MKRTFYLAAALLLCLALLFAPGLADEDAPAESTPVPTDADGETPDGATTEPEPDVTPEPADVEPTDVEPPDDTPGGNPDSPGNPGDDPGDDPGDPGGNTDNPDAPDAPGGGIDVTAAPADELIDAGSLVVEDVEGDLVDIGGGVTPTPVPTPEPTEEPAEEPSDEPEDDSALEALEAALERLTGNRHIMYAASDRLQAALTPPAPEPQLINLSGGADEDAEPDAGPVRSGPLGVAVGSIAVCALGAGASVWDYRRRRGIRRESRRRRRRREFQP